jgi:hypothetical protein
MKVYSKHELCEFIEMPLNRLNYLFKKGLPIPDNTGTHRKPVYEIDDNWYKHLHLFDELTKKNGKKGPYKEVGETGAEYIANLERMVAESGRY